LRDTAIAALVQGRETVEELSTRLGFSEPSAFRRAFPPLDGQPPGPTAATARTDGHAVDAIPGHGVKSTSRSATRAGRCNCGTCPTRPATSDRRPGTAACQPAQARHRHQRVGTPPDRQHRTADLRRVHGEVSASNARLRNVAMLRRIAARVAKCPA